MFHPPPIKSHIAVKQLDTPYNSDNQSMKPLSLGSRVGFRMFLGFQRFGTRSPLNHRLLTKLPQHTPGIMILSKLVANTQSNSCKTTGLDPCTGKDCKL